jgi:hypothetical protein
MIYLVVAGAVAAVLVWLARRSVPPPYAEFDGQVIRQWMVSGDDDSPDEWHVAVDDGTREQAWDFSVGSEPWRRLTPGTFVHARVNLRDRPDPEERVEVRHAADARPGPPPGAWRAPVVADGYLLGQAAGLTVPPLVVLLSVHGRPGWAGRRADTVVVRYH